MARGEVGGAKRAHSGVVDGKAGAIGAELGHHAADDCGNGGIVIVIGADVADRKIAHADSPPSLPVMARPTLLPLSRPSSADSQCPEIGRASCRERVCQYV